MVGEFSVGKTSLVSQFVNSVFSETYLTTVGVKIDKKQVLTNDINSNLLIWDIAGGSDSRGMLDTYIRGANGFFYVIDGTRPTTLDFAEACIEKSKPGIPAMVLMNKSDLKETWAITKSDHERIQKWNVPVLETSAKDGSNVEAAFNELTKRMVAQND